MGYELDAGGQGRLLKYFSAIGAALNNKKRRESFAIYAMGLLGSAERKSAEPLAAAVSADPEKCDAHHQRLLHFLGESPWSDHAVRREASGHAIEAMTENEPIRCWIIDDTGFPKQGTGANVMVYFSSADVPQERLRDDQFSKLQAIRKTYQDRGLLATYESVEALKTKVTLHLTSLVSSLLTKAREGNQPIPSTGTLTAPRPDIRLRIRAVLVGLRAGQMGAFVSVEIQNHAPVTFYFQSLSFAVSDGSGLMVTNDAYTRDFVMARPIQPGDSFTILVDPQDLSKHLGPGVALTNVSISDKIGRLFWGDVFELRDAVTQWQTNIQAARTVHG